MDTKKTTPRKKLGDTNVSAWVSQTVADALMGEAERRQWSRSQLVANILRNAITTFDQNV